MKPNQERMIQEVVKSINWNRIKYFHQVFGIKWQFEEKDGYVVERYPTVSELKEELRTLIKFAIEKNQRELDYGNWIIRWTDDENAKKEGLQSARLEAIFSLEETLVVDNNEEELSIQALNAKLDKAVTSEDYEAAAKIRDKINALQEKKKLS